MEPNKFRFVLAVSVLLTTFLAVMNSFKAGLVAVVLLGFAVYSKGLTLTSKQFQQAGMACFFLGIGLGLYRVAAKAHFSAFLVIGLLALGVYFSSRAKQS